MHGAGIGLVIVFAVLLLLLCVALVNLL